MFRFRKKSQTSGDLSYIVSPRSKTYPKPTVSSPTLPRVLLVLGELLIERDGSKSELVLQPVDRHIKSFLFSGEICGINWLLTVSKKMVRKTFVKILLDHVASGLTELFKSDAALQVAE